MLHVIWTVICSRRAWTCWFELSTISGLLLVAFNLPSVSWCLRTAWQAGCSLPWAHWSSFFLGPPGRFTTGAMKAEASAIELVGCSAQGDLEQAHSLLAKSSVSGVWVCVWNLRGVTDDPAGFRSSAILIFSPDTGIAFPSPCALLCIVGPGSHLEAFFFSFLKPWVWLFS